MQEHHCLEISGIVKGMLYVFHDSITTVGYILNHYNIPTVGNEWKIVLIH